MRARKAFAAVFCACALALPSGAYAIGTQPTSETGQTESSVTVTETDEIASGYSWEEGDYVFESLRLEGTDSDFSYTFELPGYYVENGLTFYVDHADGNTEILHRSLPASSGLPGTDDYISTVTIHLDVNDWVLVTGVVNVLNSSGSIGPDADPSLSVPYIEGAYREFGQSLAHDFFQTVTDTCSIQLAGTSADAVTGQSKIAAVPTVDTPGDPDGILLRYPYGFNPVDDDEVFLGCFEYFFQEEKVEDPRMPNPVTAGFKIKVDTAYAGMTAKVVIDPDNYNDRYLNSAVHETTVQEDGTFVIPYGYFQVERLYNGGYRNFTTIDEFDDHPSSGVFSISLRHKTLLSNGNVVDFAGDNGVTLNSGITLSIESCDFNLGPTWVGTETWEEFRVRAYPYTDTYGENSSGYITYRVNVGVPYSGTTATVTKWGYRYDDTDIKTYLVGSDGTFLMRDPISVAYHDFDTEYPGVDEYSVYFTIDVDPIDLSEAAVVAPIPDQVLAEGGTDTPKPTVTVGNTTLVQGTDYVLSYEYTFYTGDAIAIITGMGNYTGELRVPFKIVTSTTPSNPDGSGGSTDPGTPDDPDEDGPKPDYPALDRPFVDVPSGTWYYNAVCRVSDLGIMNGYDDGTFGPDDPLAREQAAGVLYNYLGEKDASSASAPHADVMQGQWYSRAVNWAVENGIMGGYSGTNRFGIGDALTREQFAAIIANAAGADVSKADHDVLERYPDGNEITDWALSAVAWAVENGIINGVELRDGTLELRATETMSRSQMAAMILNAIDAGAL